jgi:dihydrolipoamide dehydrogenase
MMDSVCDLLVLGAGPGGYVAAIRGAQLGLKTVCVEKEAVGGVCLNWGCIPSKALLFAGEAYRQLPHLSDYGIEVGSPRFQPDVLRKKKQAVVGQLVGGVEVLLKRNKVELLRGRGEFVDRQTLTVDLNEGGTSRVKFSKAIIATGSRPAELPHLKIDGKHVWGAREALEFDPWPKNLLIVGGGAIGVEFADFFSAFGVAVTVVEMLPRLLPTLDADLGAALAKAFSGRGVEVRTGARVTALNHKKARELVATIEAEGEKPATATFDQVLVSVGQKPYLEGIAADRLGLKLDGRGFIAVGANLETSVPGIYAIGDVVGRQLLAHKASHEGILAAEAASGRPVEMNWRNVPGGIFTEPEIATVGYTEAEARAEGIPVKVGKFPLGASGKAIATSHTQGFVKIVAHAENDTLLGAHIVGAGAADLIAPYTLALEMQATAEDVAHTIFIHPTLSEAIGEAALDVDRQAIHIFNPRRSR